ncbi:hypothetical protein [Roseateles sp.]|uniref:hypothetical protein n=1 Tax=Roseateles sp. TaxID=1971397 RepID=UPI0031D8F9AF
MNEMDRALADAAKVSPDEYYRALILQTRAIHARLNDPATLTARLVGNDNNRLKELLAVSLVLNDCTSIVYNATKQIKVNLPQNYAFTQVFGSEQIKFSLTEEQIIEEGIDRDNPVLSPCFLYSASLEQRPLMNALAPFIEDGSVVFEPSRAIITRRENAWHVLGADSRAPLDHWQLDPKGITGRPFPLEIDGGAKDTQALFDVTLPFMKGVPLKQLHAMLSNEKDLVIAFRAAIRSAVREASKASLATNEIVADIIRPKLSLLERKLKSLQRVHGIKVGGAAASSVALALTAINTPAIASTILGFASVGGFGFATSQYSDYMAKRDELQQDPFYFLWKVRRGIKTKP